MTTSAERASVPVPRPPEAVVRPFPRPDRRLQDDPQDPTRRDPVLRRCRARHRSPSPSDRLAGRGQPPRHSHPVPSGGRQGRQVGRIRGRPGQEALAAEPRAQDRRGGTEVGQRRCCEGTHRHPEHKRGTWPGNGFEVGRQDPLRSGSPYYPPLDPPTPALLTNPKSNMTLSHAPRSPSLASLSHRRPAGPLVRTVFSFGGFLTRPQRLGVSPEPAGSLSRGCNNGEGHGQVVQ